MPTYAYKCRDCGQALEVQQAFTDASLTECPTCGGALRKQYGTVGVTFNGSGFYRTDSRAGDGKGPDGKGPDGKGGEKKESTDAPKADAPKADSGSKESKPADKPAAPKPAPATAKA